MTIEELKSALVEVRDICKGTRYCCEPEMCPFWDTETVFCAIRDFPMNWLVDDLKEDSNATD